MKKVVILKEIKFFYETSTIISIQTAYEKDYRVLHTN